MEKFNIKGYGCSNGKPSEKNLYADIAAALQVLKTKYQIPEEEIILYGQSIGTVPSVDVAIHNPNIAGLILHSPLMSGNIIFYSSVLHEIIFKILGMRVAFPGTTRTYCLL